MKVYALTNTYVAYAISMGQNDSLNKGNIVELKTLNQVIEEVINLKKERKINDDYFIMGFDIPESKMIIKTGTGEVEPTTVKASDLIGKDTGDWFRCSPIYTEEYIRKAIARLEQVIDTRNGIHSPQREF